MNHVLVVDDDLAVCETICEALRDRHLSAECSATDTGAYSRLAEAPAIDALVLDVNLGAGTTGYDIARYARRLIPGVAVVYVSGAVSPASVKAYGVPSSEFFEKPFIPAELADVLVRKLSPSP